MLFNRYDLDGIIPEQKVNTFMIMLSRNASPIFKNIMIDTHNRGKKTKAICSISHYRTSEIIYAIEKRIKRKPNYSQKHMWKETINTMQRIEKILGAKYGN